MVVLDTNFLIDVMQGNPEAARRLEDLLESTASMAISAITVMELHHGIPRSKKPQKEAERIDRGLRGITTYPITYDIAAKAGRIDGELVDRGEPIGIPDVLIAASALKHAEPVLTRNTRHFKRISGLEILSY